MSHLRKRRLENDHEGMKSLRMECPFIDFTTYGDPPERYVVSFSCKGLIRKNNAPAFSVRHEVEIYLRNEYPTQKPHLKWLTPIFHPNITGSEHMYNAGMVCPGKWVPSMSLRELCIKMAEMIQYKNYDTVGSLDTNAAEWANQNKHNLPVDRRDLLIRKYSVL